MQLSSTGRNGCTGLNREYPFCCAMYSCSCTNLVHSDLDVLATFETAGAHILAAQAPTRFAVRQVLDQELYKTKVNRENAARQARFRAGGSDEDFHFDDKGC